MLNKLFCSNWLIGSFTENILKTVPEKQRNRYIFCNQIQFYEKILTSILNTHFSLILSINLKIKFYYFNYCAK